MLLVTVLLHHDNAHLQAAVVPVAAMQHLRLECLRYLPLTAFILHRAIITHFVYLKRIYADAEVQGSLQIWIRKQPSSFVF